LNMEPTVNEWREPAVVIFADDGGAGGLSESAPARQGDAVGVGVVVATAEATEAPDAAVLDQSVLAGSIEVWTRDSVGSSSGGRT
jgi:hypothetical protein